MIGKLMNSASLPPVLDISYDEIARYCARYHIQRMWLFGSILNEAFTDDSDVDVLVEFEDKHLPGWAFFGEMPQQLESLLRRKIDLLTPDSLSRYMRDDVMREAVLIYGSS